MNAIRLYTLASFLPTKFLENKFFSICSLELMHNLCIRDPPAPKKNPPANARDTGDAGSIPASGPRSRAWRPTPVFLLGESHGQRNGGLRSMWSQRVGQDWSDLARKHGARAMRAGRTSVYLRWVPQRRRSHRTLPWEGRECRSLSRVRRVQRGQSLLSDPPVPSQRANRRDAKTGG